MHSARSLIIKFPRCFKDLIQEKKNKGSGYSSFWAPRMTDYREIHVQPFLCPNNFFNGFYLFQTISILFPLRTFLYPLWLAEMLQCIYARVGKKSCITCQAQKNVHTLVTEPYLYLKSCSKNYSAKHKHLRATDI